MSLIINHNQSPVNMDSENISSLTIVQTVTDAFNNLFQSETDAYCGSTLNQHNPNRNDFRNGTLKKSITLPVLGVLNLEVPRTRKGGIPSTTYEALQQQVTEERDRLIVELYAKGISVRDIPSVLETAGFEPVQKSRISEIIIEIARPLIEEFESRDLSGQDYPILYVDSLFDPIRYGGCYHSMAIMAVYGISLEGTPELLGLVFVPGESAKPYIDLFEDLKSRGLKTPLLVVSDGNLSIKEAVSNCFPGCLRQSCYVHGIRKWMRLLPKKTSMEERSVFGKRLAAVFDAPTKQEAIEKARKLIDEFKGRYPEAVGAFEESYVECLSFYDLPEIHSKFTRSSNLIERQNSEFRRRLDKVHAMPNPEAYKRLILLSRRGRSWFDKVLIPPEQLRAAREAGEERKKQLTKELQGKIDEFCSSLQEEICSQLYSQTLFGIQLVYEPVIYDENNGGLLAGILFAYGITDKGRRYPFAYLPEITSQERSVRTFLKLLEEQNLTTRGYICHNLTETSAVKALEAGAPGFQIIYNRNDLRERVVERIPTEDREEADTALIKLLDSNTPGAFEEQLGEFLEAYQEKYPEAVNILLEHTESYLKLLEMIQGAVSLKRCSSLETAKTLIHSAGKLIGNGFKQLVDKPGFINAVYESFKSLLNQCADEIGKNAYINRNKIQSVLA